MLKSIYFQNKGFTLIELMIVVAIIGILASIAIPNFILYQCKAKQAEARVNLGNIRIAESAHRAVYDRYSSTQVIIGFTPIGHSRYTYSIVASKSTFTASAKGKSGTDVENDLWTVDETGSFNNSNNTCQ